MNAGRGVFCFPALIALFLWPLLAHAVQDDGGSYPIQPGDLLRLHVWGEEELNADLLVRPDGYLSLPLIGDVNTGGRTPAQVADAIKQKLETYLPDPVVTLSLLQAGGHVIYVIGQVNRPGEIPMKSPLDVMQALSVAGGTTAFARPAKIRILRRDGGKPVVISFDYSEVEKGENLQQNLILQSGDVVVVP